MIPRFSPEHFARVRLRDPLRRKQLKRGLEELSREGAVQLFFDRRRLEREPVLGAVGLLQFDVVRHRLLSEYDLEADLERLPFRAARWVAAIPEDLNELERQTGALCLLDQEERPVLLFKDDFEIRIVQRRFPDLGLAATAHTGRGVGDAAA